MAFVYWLHKESDTDMFSTGYVGVTTQTVQKRYLAHKYSAKCGSKLAVHRAILKYGDLIVDTILEGSEEYCYIMEGRLRPIPSVGYNAAIGGGISPTTGTFHSDESRKKMSAATAGEKHSGYGKKQSPELVAKRVAGSLKTRIAKEKAGVVSVVSQETRDKLSAAGRGKVRSDEARKNYSEATSGEKNPNFGKTGWRGFKCNKTIWASAQSLFDLYVGFKTCGRAKLATAHGTFTADNLEVITKWFKAGWNPSEDIPYQTWLSEYKLNKETTNVP